MSLKISLCACAFSQMVMVTAMAMVTANVMATMCVLAMAMRLVGNEEGKCKGSKGDGNGNEGGRRQQGQGRQGDGDGSKNCRTAMATKRAMVMATMVGEQWQW